MTPLDFTELLEDLIDTGSEAAVVAGIKMLTVYKDSREVLPGELDALRTVASLLPGTQASKAADKILQAQPHCYVAEW